MSRRETRRQFLTKFGAVTASAYFSLFGRKVSLGMDQAVRHRSSPLVAVGDASVPAKNLPGMVQSYDEGGSVFTYLYDAHGQLISAETTYH